VAGAEYSKPQYGVSVWGFEYSPAATPSSGGSRLSSPSWPTLQFHAQTFLSPAWDRRRGTLLSQPVPISRNQTMVVLAHVVETQEGRATRRNLITASDRLAVRMVEGTAVGGEPVLPAVQQLDEFGIEVVPTAVVRQFEASSGTLLSLRCRKSLLEPKDQQGAWAWPPAARPLARGTRPGRQRLLPVGRRRRRP